MSEMSRCDILAVFAHPDDESLLAGGMLAACAAAGQRVGIVSLTRGEWGPIATPEVPRAMLGAVREGELAAAGRELGAAWSHCLALPDGELASTDRPAAVAAVAEILNNCAARMLVTFADDGLYWHPDHLAAREVVLDAAGSLPVCEVTWPSQRVTEVIDEARRRGGGAELWGIEAEAFGSPAETIACELDVRSFLGAKRRALGCHRSQLTAGHLLIDLPDDLALSMLGYEWLKSPPGGGPMAEIVDLARAPQELR
jgi:LmbE family N-acetylglucosaminyl deacetylase